MSLSILIDMNLSAEWVDYLTSRGWSVTHWSSIGRPDAPDSDLLNWAGVNGHAILTHDLDFSALLARTGATAPSIIQFRCTSVLPEDIGATVASALRRYERDLSAGAIVVVEPSRARVRILPLDG